MAYVGLAGWWRFWTVMRKMCDMRKYLHPQPRELEVKGEMDLENEES